MSIAPLRLTSHPPGTLAQYSTALEAIQKPVGFSDLERRRQPESLSISTGDNGPLQHAWIVILKNRELARRSGNAIAGL